MLEFNLNSDHVKGDICDIYIYIYIIAQVHAVGVFHQWKNPKNPALLITQRAWKYFDAYLVVSWRHRRRRR